MTNTTNDIKTAITNAGLTLTRQNGNWYYIEFPDGLEIVVNGKKKVMERINEYIADDLEEEDEEEEVGEETEEVMEVTTTTTTYTENNQYYTVINKSKGGWFTIHHTQLNIEQKIHGKKNLEIIFSIYELNNQPQPEVKSNLQEFVTEAHVNRTQDLVLDNEPIEVTPDPLHEEYVSEEVEEEIVNVVKDLGDFLPDVVPHRNNKMEKEIEQEELAAREANKITRAELDKKILKAQEEYNANYNDADQLWILEDEVTNLIDMAMDAGVEYDSLNVLLSQITSRVETLQSQEIKITKQESVSIESDIIAPIMARLHELEDEEVETLDIAHELEQEAQELINQINSFEMDNKSTTNSRKAKALAYAVVERFDAIICELEDSDSWEEE